MSKTRVLLNWDTTRKDLMEPFIQLKDELDIIVIWGNPSEDEKNNHPFRQIRFIDYSTPYALLDDIKPDRILFFNVNNFPQVALNCAARNRGIATYTMHHGIHHADFLEINREKVRLGGHKAGRLLSNFKTFQFYFGALRWRNRSEYFSFIKFAWYRQRMERTLACERCVFPSRLPDWYIDLSPHNAIIAKKIDRLYDDKRFIYIGHPFFDQILNQLNALSAERSPVSTPPYWLLIDFPNNDHVLQFKLMTAEGKRTFYKRLSALAKSVGCRLKIKLHPFGYESPHNYTDENIDLIRDGDIASLIYHAEKCFSFFSTLIIPIIYHKKSCFIFHIGQDRQLQDDLVRLGVGIRLEALSFTEADITTNQPELPEEIYREFVSRYLYFTDGRSTQRLGNILAGL